VGYQFITDVFQDAKNDPDDASVPAGIVGVVRLDDHLWFLHEAGGEAVE
jgi:hypothetical protein